MHPFSHQQMTPFSKRANSSFSSWVLRPLGIRETSETSFLGCASNVVVGIVVVLSTYFGDAAWLIAGERMDA